ncbi:hypothetical protein ACP275_08G101300 [Erythranthe tilingii]
MTRGKREEAIFKGVVDAIHLKLLQFNNFGFVFICKISIWLLGVNLNYWRVNCIWFMYLGVGVRHIACVKILESMFSICYGGLVFHIA